MIFGPDAHKRAFLQRNQQEFFNDFQMELIKLAGEAGYAATNEEIKDGRFVYQYGLGEGRIVILAGREADHSRLVSEEKQVFGTTDYALQVNSGNKEGDTMSLSCQRKDAAGFAAYILDRFRKDPRRNYGSG